MQSHDLKDAGTSNGYSISTTHTLSLSLTHFLSINKHKHKHSLSLSLSLSHEEERRRRSECGPLFFSPWFKRLSKPSQRGSSMTGRFLGCPNCIGLKIPGEKVKKYRPGLVHLKTVPAMGSATKDLVLGQFLIWSSFGPARRPTPPTESTSFKVDQFFFRWNGGETLEPRCWR